jgi:serine/threonine protein kinase
MVAVKVINWSKLQQLRGRHLEDPIKELAAMQLVGNYHPHIIPLKDSLQDETHLFCIYPFLTGGDLYGRLWEEMQLSPSGRIEENQARNWFRQILSALSHLQKKGVCHRDLRMENMMLEKQSDGTMNIRIIDFGLCLRVPYVDPNNRNLVTDVSSDTVRRLIKAQGQGGKWEYMAPEVARRQECFDGFAIDLWTVGILLFEFLVGKKPFALPDSSDPNFYMIAVEGNLEGLLRMKGISLDQEACDLLQKMLQSDPSKRLTLAEVVGHPWVNRGHNERKPKPILTSVEESNGWFIQNNAIDDNDPNEYDLAHRMRLMSCSSGDDGTAESTTFDEESRNPRVSTQSMPYNLSDEQLLNDIYGEKPVPATVEHGMLQLGIGERKKKGLTSFFNPKKLWKGHAKKTSRLTSIESGVRSKENEDVPSKTELRGDGRMC